MSSLVVHPYLIIYTIYVEYKINMNIDENITIFNIPPQVDKDFKNHYAKWRKPPFKVVILSTYNCTQAKVDKQNFHMGK
jgi:predicted nuclease of predicted toxin-antitoxin system